MSYSEKQMAMQKRAGKLLLDNMVQSNEIHDVKTMLTFMNGWDLMADPEALGILEKMKKREKTKKGSRGVKNPGFKKVLKRQGGNSLSPSVSKKGKKELMDIKAKKTTKSGKQDVNRARKVTPLLQQSVKIKRKRRIKDKYKINFHSRALLKSLGYNHRKIKYQSKRVQDQVSATKPYNIKLLNVISFGKDLGFAKDKEYEVQFKDALKGKNLKDIMYGLETLFDEVIDDAKQGLSNTDLGRVVIAHESLNNPIVLNLRPLGDLKGAAILNKVESVMNSAKSLKIDDSFKIFVGVIELPKFGGYGTAPNKSSRRRIHLETDTVKKRSIVTITRDGHLCMARAIGVCWVKKCQVSEKQFKTVTARDVAFAKSVGLPPPTKLDLFLKYRIAPPSLYNTVKKQVTLTRKKVKRDCVVQRKLAIGLCELSNVDPFTKASLVDIHKFEKTIGLTICIVSRQAQNKFITQPSRGSDKIFLYKDGDHFHGIVKITGFFRSSHFCNNCLQPFEKVSEHVCDICCDMCGRQDCCKLLPVGCDTCNHQCRSKECLERHKEKGNCGNKWKCIRCCTTFNLSKDKRKPKDHVCGEYKCITCAQYVTKPHLCYTRAEKPDNSKLRVIHFDFECMQNQIKQCVEGYVPMKLGRCTSCTGKISKCAACFRCVNCYDEICGRPIHIPNFVVAHSSCDDCEMDDIDDNSTCISCGSRCHKCDKIVKTKTEGDVICEYASMPCEGCGKRKQVFKGETTLNDFGSWLFNESHKDFTVMAHNMKGYDGIFLSNYLVQNGLSPKVTYAGTKIMSIHVQRGLNIRVIDSMNFIQTSLAAFTKTFGLEGVKKGEFPHLFNTPENQRYIGPYPHEKYYNIDYMSEEKREKFLEWYKTIPSEAIFDFKKEIASYCNDDVNILRKGTLKFRKDMINVTGKVKTIEKDGLTEDIMYDYVDPFQCITIAGVAMKTFRTNFLKEYLTASVTDKDGRVQTKVPLVKKHNTYYCRGEEMTDVEINNVQFLKSPIAYLSSEIYRTNDNFSKLSMKWLNYMAHEKKIKIQHALNGGEKEVRIGKSFYKLDGYHFNEATKQKTAYEMDGCIWHGCEECFPFCRNEPIDNNVGDTLNIRRGATNRKRILLENAGYKVVSIRECEFNHMLDTDESLSEYCKELEEISDYMVGRLDARDAFFGGRTNAVKLYLKVDKAKFEKIKYVDFTSLYPWVNKYMRFPEGHPEMITDNFKNISEYFGFGKVKVLPPTDLYHPVLPVTSRGKLKFSLCRTCAEKENCEPCICSDDDRAFIGTWATPEILLAVKKGYTILKIYEIWHFKESSKLGEDAESLFSEYVNTFLKIKQEASGWPEHIDPSNHEERNEYIQKYYEREGIRLDENKIAVNPGLRALAKLLANALWGKFGQKARYDEIKYFHDTECEQFFSLFLDKTKTVNNFTILNDTNLMVEYETKKAFTRENKHTNIFIAAFTTMWARLKLYDVIDMLGERVVYMDTDSVIFITWPGCVDPQVGDYLGDLTNEISPQDGCHINEYVSAGPKNYAYETPTGKQVCKIRGFSLNYMNNKILNLASLRDMIINDQSQKKTIFNENKICRNKIKSVIFNRPEERVYKMVYTKRIIQDNYDTLPYGYRK